MAVMYIYEYWFHYEPIINSKLHSAFYGKDTRSSFLETKADGA